MIMVEVVMKLVRSLKEGGHIIIADRGFGSILLAEEIHKSGNYFLLSCRYLIFTLFCSSNFI